MRLNFLFACSMLFLSGCCSLDKAINDFTFDINSYLKADAKSQLTIRKLILVDERRHLPKVLDEALKSDYTDCCCNDFKNAEVRHETASDLLLYLYRFGHEQTEIQRYFEINMNPSKNYYQWFLCYITLRSHCASRFNEISIGMMPTILKDTTSLESSYCRISNFQSRISIEFSGMCHNLAEKLKSDTLWRKEICKSLLVQLKTFGKDEDFSEIVYITMDDLLDRNTTQFAYDYLMKNDDLPDELGNILISRANKNYLKAAGILGEGISLSSEQKQSVISRMEYLDSIGKLEPDFQEWLAEQQKEPKE